MTGPVASRRTRHPRVLLSAAAVGTVAAILAVSACSGGGDNGDSASPPQFDAAVPSDVGSAGSAGSAGPDVPASRVAVHRSSLNDIGSAAFDRAQIKTARIQLRSDRIVTVVANVEQVAATEGGFIDSENTVTNVHGIATSSSITLRVPVDRFDAAVSAVSALGQLASKRTTTQDVTGQVADVASRVQSAKEAIAQLRILFNRATKLGDIITLESQLSSREADLEALEAQQRALTDQTSLSTIAVLVTRPPVVAPKPTHEDNSGFVGGLKQGWDALASTMAAVAHGLGAVLPLGVVLSALGLLVWSLVRRIPRHRPNTSG
jgi:uncharacterized protein DUF4349